MASLSLCSDDKQHHYTTINYLPSHPPAYPACTHTRRLNGMTLRSFYSLCEASDDEEERRDLFLLWYVMLTYGRHLTPTHDKQTELLTLTKNSS